MGQIINSVCLALSVPHSHCRISWSIFSKSGTEVTTPKSKNEFVGVNITPRLPLFCPQNRHFGPKGPENPCKCKYANFCLKCLRIAGIPTSYREIRVGEHDNDVRFQTGLAEYPVAEGSFAHVHRKTCNITLIYDQIAKTVASYRQSGSRNMIVTSQWTQLCGRYHVPQSIFRTLQMQFHSHCITAIKIKSNKIVALFLSIYTRTYLHSTCPI